MSEELTLKAGAEIESTKVPFAETLGADATNAAALVTP